MISAGNALAPGPGNSGKATFRWPLFPIRPWSGLIDFERFTGFQAFGSAGGNDFPPSP